MKKFNLSAVARATSSREFSQEQRDIFYSCELLTLDSSNGEISMEDLSGGMIAGMIAALIGLLWGAYKRFFGESSGGGGGGGGGGVSASIGKYEKAFSPKNEKVWNESWANVEPGNKPSSQASKSSNSKSEYAKVVYSEELVEKLFENVRFRGLAASQVFKMEFKNSSGFCDKILKAANALVDPIESLIKMLEQINSSNSRDISNRLNSLKMGVAGDLNSVATELSKLTDLKYYDTSSFESTLMSISNAADTARSKNFNTIDDSEYKDHCRKVVREGSSIFSGFSLNINKIKDIERDVESAERHALNKLESHKHFKSSDSPETETQKEIISALRNITTTLTRTLAYVVHDLDVRSHYIETIQKVLLSK